MDCILDVGDASNSKVLLLFSSTNLEKGLVSAMKTSKAALPDASVLVGRYT